jgi:hypothetical protein
VIINIDTQDKQDFSSVSGARSPISSSYLDYPAHLCFLLPYPSTPLTTGTLANSTTTPSCLSCPSMFPPPLPLPLPSPRARSLTPQPPHPVYPAHLCFLLPCPSTPLTTGTLANSTTTPSCLSCPSMFPPPLPLPLPAPRARSLTPQPPHPVYPAHLCCLLPCPSHSPHHGHALQFHHPILSILPIYVCSSPTPPLPSPRARSPIPSSYPVYPVHLCLLLPYPSTPRTTGTLANSTTTPSCLSCSSMFAPTIYSPTTTPLTHKRHKH